MDTVALKPCPFCGNDAKLAFCVRDSCDAREISFVKCKSCGATGQKFEVSRMYASDEKAVEAWNTRVFRKE